MENDTSLTDIWEGYPHQAVNFWVFASCILMITAPYALYCYLKAKRTVYRLNTEWLIVKDDNFAAVKVCEIKEVEVNKPWIYGWLGLADLLIKTKSDNLCLRGLLEYDKAKRIIEKH